MSETKSLTVREILNLNTGFSSLVKITKEDSALLKELRNQKNEDGVTRAFEVKFTPRVSGDLEYRIIRTMKKLIPEIEAYQEANEGNLEKYAERNYGEDGSKNEKGDLKLVPVGWVFPDDESRKQYNNANKLLLNKTIELEGTVFMLKASELNAIDGLTMEDKMLLYPLTEDDSKELDIKE